MSFENFEYLLTLIGPKVQRCDTNFRRAITVKKRLAITLRYFHHCYNVFLFSAAQCTRSAPSFISNMR
ncbi:hypothetical protein PGB90_004930 [Kerria lacca]